MSKATERLSTEQFFKKAIVNLRKEQYKGIHSVYSGVNAAFRKYYPELDPIAEVNKLHEKGVIFMRPVKGGVMLYLPNEAPTRDANVLDRILETEKKQ